MTFKINYGQNELTSLMKILDVRRNIGADKENKVEDKVGGGSNFISSRRKQKIIEVDFISFEIAYIAREKIAKMLDSDILQQLIFSDKPNEYWDAIVDGEVSFKEGATGNDQQERLNFLSLLAMQNQLIQKY